MSSPRTHAVTADGAAGWWAFLRRFLGFAGGWWRSRERWTAWTLTVSLILLTAMQVGVAIALNLWNLRFFNALEQRALDRFLTLIGVFALIVAANVAITVSHLQVKRRLQVNWRRWLTRRLVQDWMSDGHHHTLSLAPGRHDNPDGRIAEDIRIATEYAVDIGHSGLYSTMLLVSFVSILWGLSGVLSASLAGVEFAVPGHLVWLALAYTAIGAWVALRLGRPLTRAANRRQASEADFRFGLAHARAHGLAIALMRGEPDERRRFLRLFHRAFRAWDRQTDALRRFFYYMASWPLLSQIFPILVSAPRYIAGSISLGVLMQSAQAFGQVVAALSWPIDNLAKAAEWRASAERARQLDSALADLERDGGRAGRIVRAAGPVLEFDSVVLTDVDGRPLTGIVDLAVRPGEKVMVVGDATLTGHLFHAVAGLWPWGLGRIVLPAGDVHFMPERPYIAPGRLHDAACYPSHDGFGVVRVIGALGRAGLERWADHLEESAPWDQNLSLADQQRLGFARLLLHAPAWVVLHDAASALDVDAERDMLRLIGEAHPGAAVLIVGRRPGLEEQVDRLIEITPP
jgi:putative ATP-binding cassette transporter